MSADPVVSSNAFSDDASRRALWWEVAAVLAVGIVPNLYGAITGLFFPARPTPSWLDSLDLTISSACVVFVTLYLIHRSGEPWSSFGIVRPQAPDFLLGPLLSAAACFVLIRASEARADADSWTQWYIPPQGIAEYALLVVAHAANGLTEELVTRAYLITRLERLLQSPTKALVISTVLFTSYHLYYGIGPWLGAIALVGLGFGAVYLWLRRLWPLVIGHGLANIILVFY